MDHRRGQHRGRAATGQTNVYPIDYATRTATLIHQFSDNWGHENDLSYAPSTNQLIFSDDTDPVTPAVFYTVNVGNIDLDGTNTLASSDAVTFDVPASLANDVNVVWTGQPNVAVLISNNTAMMSKIKLANRHRAVSVRQLRRGYARPVQRHLRGARHLPHEQHHTYLNGATWVNCKLYLSEGYDTIAVIS